MKVLLSLRGELLKTKRTASWYLTVLSAASVPLVFVMDVCSDGVSSRNSHNPLMALYVEGLKGINFLILPMFTILVCTLLPQIEFRNNTWKQVLAAPQTKAQIFISKFVMVQLFIILFLAVFLISTPIGSIVINSIVPSVRLFDHSIDWSRIAIYIARTYLSVFAVSVLQFTVGLMIKNFITPIAIGLILWITGNLLLFEFHSSLVNVVPYSYSAMVMFPEFESSLTMIQWSSMGYGALFLIIGYIFFEVKK